MLLNILEVGFKFWPVSLKQGQLIHYLKSVKVGHFCAMNLFVELRDVRLKKNA